MEAAPFDHAAVLLACARGEQAAFHRLYEHEAPHMLALAQRLLPGDAEGLTHDTLALIWRNADQYDASMGPARPWIYSVLRHVAHGRRLRQNAAPSLSAPALPQPFSVRGKLAALATHNDSVAYEAIAHGYLHGADYRRLADWLGHDPGRLRQSVRQGLKECAA